MVCDDVPLAFTTVSEARAGRIYWPAFDAAGRAGATPSSLALFARPAPPACGLDWMSPARRGLSKVVMKMTGVCGFKQHISPSRSCGSQPKISKTTPCKVAGGRRHGCASRKYLTRRANQRHSFIVAQSVKRPWPAMARSSDRRADWSRWSRVYKAATDTNKTLLGVLLGYFGGKAH